MSVFFLHFWVDLRIPLKFIGLLGTVNIAMSFF